MKKNQDQLKKEFIKNLKLLEKYNKFYFENDAQKAEAERTIKDVDASGLWPDKVVTEVEPVGDFWEAEPEHQDYLERIPNGYTCHYVRPNWVLPSSE